MGNVVTVRDDGTKRCAYYTEGPSLTRQEFKNDCDLGMIIKRFSQSPEGLEQLELARGYVQSRFDDVSDFVDYRTALDQVRQADEAFMRLPAIVRTKFDNDPVKFLEFVDDEKNIDELRSLGLAKPKVVEELKKGPEIVE